MLIDKFDAKKFKNPRLAKAIEAFLSLEADFQMSSRSNDAFGGILITFMQSFREDADAIASLIGNPAAAPKATIIPVKFVERHGATVVNPDCATCGPSKALTPNSIPATPKVAPAPAQEEIEAFPTTIREVLNMFSGDMEQMRAFAKANGISFAGNTGKEALAQKILNSFQQ